MPSRGGRRRDSFFGLSDGEHQPARRRWCQRVEGWGSGAPSAVPASADEMLLHDPAAAVVVPLHGVAAIVDGRLPAWARHPASSKLHSALGGALSSAVITPLLCGLLPHLDPINQSGQTGFTGRLFTHIFCRQGCRSGGRCYSKEGSVKTDSLRSSIFSMSTYHSPCCEHLILS